MLRKRLVKLLLAFGVVAAISAIAALWFSSSHTSPAPMPNPNGYDEIVRAGCAISSNFWDYKTMDTNELRAALKTNATAISRGRQALKLECRVRLHWLPGSNDVDEEMAPVNLYSAFAAEARLAELENRLPDAINCYLEMARLGDQSSRGGLVADGLQSIGMEFQSIDCLQKLSARLDARSCKEIAKTIERLDSQREPMTEYERQEKILFDQNTTGFGRTITYYYMRFWFRAGRQKPEKTFLKRHFEIRQSIIAIASRAYKLDKGSAPQKITDLVPDYLTAVPTDPSTGKAMKLSP